MRVRHWGASSSTPATPAAVTPPPVASTKQLVLRGEDYFVRKRTFLGTVWSIRSRSISWLASILNLYLLVNAIRALHAFTPLGVDDYAITELASAEACLASLKSREEVHSEAALPMIPTGAAGSNATSSLAGFANRALGQLATGLRDAANQLTHEVHEVTKQAHTHQDDLASIMRTCRNQLASSEPEGLTDVKLGYWYLAYAIIAIALFLDLLRWCGCGCSITDAILGFRSERVERFRLLPQLIMLLPFAHLTWLLSKPIPLPCCEGTPKLSCVMDRVRVLAWLSLLVSYCLFADAHNHGYFLLRSTEASACRLLRPSLGKASASAANSPEPWSKV